MKKLSIWLLMAGSLCMSSSILARHFIFLQGSTEDFLKGFGVSLMIGALFLRKQALKNC